MSRFTVIRDSREKEGHGWWYDEDAYCIGTEITKLDIGDYSIKDKEHILCRKLWGKKIFARIKSDVFFSSLLSFT
jgi:hypothetical protein